MKEHLDKIRKEVFERWKKRGILDGLRQMDKNSELLKLIQPEERVVLNEYIFEINKTYFGDCLEVMKCIPDKSVNLILADPPFDSTQCLWDSPIDLPKMWEQYKRIIKDNGDRKSVV